MRPVIGSVRVQVTKELYTDNAHKQDRKSTSKIHTKNFAVHSVVWLLRILLFYGLWSSAVFAVKCTLTAKLSDLRAHAATKKYS